MSAILVAVDGPQAADWLAALRDNAKGREVLAWPLSTADMSRVAFACVWLPPQGMLARLPKLKAVINLGAGADHLLADPALPAVPVARVAHADLTMPVTEQFLLPVPIHHR